MYCECSAQDRRETFERILLVQVEHHAGTMHVSSTRNGCWAGYTACSTACSGAPDHISEDDFLGCAIIKTERTSDFGMHVLEVGMDLVELPNRYHVFVGTHFSHAQKLCLFSFFEDVSSSGAHETIVDEMKSTQVSVRACGQPLEVVRTSSG